MTLEEQITQWRGHVARRHAIADGDVVEMEEHLREQVADLVESGLDDDEAFLVAVKRMGSLDALSREFAREHSERLWRQLVLTEDGDAGRASRRELWLVLALGVAAALALRAGIAWLAPELAGRLAAVLVFPFLAAYFGWKRRVGFGVVGVLAAAFAATALVLVLYPYEPGGQNDVLAMLHAPILLWLVVGVGYVGGDWRSRCRRMDFIRFTGEWVVYYVLLALGGGVLIGLTVAAFAALQIDAENVIAEWVAPCGAAGAVLVAAWLVEAKQAVIENIAPVLTRVFTPLAVLMLIAVLVAFGVSPGVLGVNRDLLILMALILVLVLGLLLYEISARDPQAPPGFFDWLQLGLVGAAIVVDAVVLVAMSSRIAEFGATPNKVAALGLNIVVLVNLAWSAWLLAGFGRGRRPFAALEQWQTGYVPVYLAWAAAVITVLPPVFGFV